MSSFSSSRAKNGSKGSAAAAADAMSSGEVHKARGNELLKAGDFAAAAEAYGEAIKADPSVSAFWSNRSHALLRSGDAEGALSDADEAAKLQPHWPKAHYRRAQALKELGRPKEAAQACESALSLVEGGGNTSSAEAKELRKLRELMSSAAAAIALFGWWHGEVSKELGGFMQEFCFLSEGELRCCVYGQELPGKYVLRDVEVYSSGALQGGVDVSLNNEKVPYLFRAKGDGVLDLCCPMTSPPERPRTFQGPGHVSMLRGREAGGDELASLSEGQKVVRYLQELFEALDTQVPQDSGGGATADQACERLLEEGEGGKTMHSQQIMGPESLEDKARKMAYENHMQALRVKYSDEIDATAQRLLKGEVRASEAFPNEARDLDRLIRRVQRSSPGDEDAPEAEGSKEKSGKAGAAPAAEPSKKALASSSPPLSAPAPPPPPAAASPVPSAPAGGCCGGCFAGFLRK